MMKTDMHTSQNHALDASVEMRVLIYGRKIIRDGKKLPCRRGKSALQQYQTVTGGVSRSLGAIRDAGLIEDMTYVVRDSINADNQLVGVSGGAIWCITASAIRAYTLTVTYGILTNLTDIYQIIPSDITNRRRQP